MYNIFDKTYRLKLTIDLIALPNLSSGDTLKPGIKVRKSGSKVETTRNLDNRIMALNMHLSG